MADAQLRPLLDASSYQDKRSKVWFALLMLWLWWRLDGGIVDFRRTARDREATQLVFVALQKELFTPVYQSIRGVVLSSNGGEDKPHVMLGNFRATAICGNDITGSCLYTAGLCVATVSAGI